jgi:hypothetical protein
MLRDGDCSMWTPRDLLTAMLREMDAGLFPADGIVVCYFRRENGSTMTGMKRSKTTVMEAVAMVEMAKHDLLRAELIE